MEENNGCGQQSIIFMVIAIVFVLLVFISVMMVSLGILTLGGSNAETAESHTITVEETIIEPEFAVEETVEPEVEATVEPEETTAEETEEPGQ